MMGVDQLTLRMWTWY